MGSIQCPHCSVHIGYVFRKPKRCPFCNIRIDDPRPHLTEEELEKLWRSKFSSQKKPKETTG
jgi:hypothetical protein